MTDYASCPWCNVTSMVTKTGLDRKCEHAVASHKQIRTATQQGGTVVRFATPDRMEFKNVVCAVRSVMTDERFFKAIEVMDLNVVEEIQRKLDNRRAELELLS